MGDGVAAREATARELEEKSEIRFEVIRNDGDMKRLEQLATLKQIFAAQLPKMPREYIVRLVFDRRHVSLAVLRGADEVLGGICYRPFVEQEFAEIAFCAITASEQVRGFGTRVMNHLKERAKVEGIRYFLTYADNYATGYFKKQGFSSTVTLPKERWYGSIKDYDGGTLMECYVHPTVDYLNVRRTLKRQREWIERKLDERFRKSTPRTIGGTASVDFFSFQSSAPPPEKGEGGDDDHQRGGSLLDAVPGLRELGYTDEELRKLARPVDPRGEKRREELASAKTLIDRTKKSAYAWPFLEPVDVEEVTDYLDVIKDPVDLKTIEDRLKAGDTYTSFTQVKADVLRMLQNCRTYNVSGIYVKTADTLEKAVLAEARKLEDSLVRFIADYDAKHDLLY
mmetsp:Transcript_11534/g.37899  ORF Transcript_11534/g.37899 Transcript_11534/m.37899 type:complete len:397 (-) Transcript_11534:2398-3588(-)